MNKATWFVATAASLLVSGLPAATMALTAENPDRVALEAAAQRWAVAVNARDVVTLTATMTEDVELLDGTTSVKGRATVLRTLREAAARGQLAATSRELTIAKDVAWRVGALTQTQKNGDVQARGQTLEIWKRVKGHWQLHRQMAAGVIAPADSISRPPGDPVLDRTQG